MKKKYSLDDFPDLLRFLMLAQMQVVVNLRNKEYDKEKYIDWCRAVWDTVNLNGMEKIKETLENEMQKDILKYSQRLKEDLDT